MSTPDIGSLLSEINNLSDEVKDELEALYLNFKCFFILKALSSDNVVIEMCNSEMSVIVQKAVDLMNTRG